MSTETSKLKKQLKAKKTKSEPIPASSYLSTGSTLLNLACTNRPEGGFVNGNYFFFVGDSASGKTWLSLTCFAEATKNKNYKKHRLIYDNGEQRSKLINLEKYFGSETVRRLEAPSEDAEGNPLPSETAQEFYANVHYALDNEEPFIYVLDSENSLTSDSEKKKADQQRKALDSGKEVAGSYGDGKAKVHSENLRQLMQPLSQNNSILIVISQTRDNLNPMSFEKKTYSGGRALRFYAALEIWTALKSKIYKTVKGQKRQVGILVQVKVKKNSITGKERTIEIPIYHSFGIDDVGSCVDYLIAEKHWAKKKNTIVAHDIDFEGSRDKLIEYIEENDMEDVLREVVGEVWQAIESACEVKRKPRYE